MACCGRGGPCFCCPGCCCPGSCCPPPRCPCGPCPCPQQCCPIPCCMPLSCAPGCQMPRPPRGNACPCPSFWPPVCYTPQAQKICIVVNNCPPQKPNTCEQTCCEPSATQGCGSQGNSGSQGSQGCGQQNGGGSGGQQNQQQEQLCCPPIRVEYCQQQPQC